MSDFDLDLRAAEEHLDEQTDLEGNVVLGILDGTTPPEEWLEEISQGNVLVCSVEGDVNQRAAGFARDVKEAGGNLVHFRGFLIVTPPGVEVDRNRLAGDE